jgi:hypothetical protein
LSGRSALCGQMTVLFVLLSVCAACAGYPVPVPTQALPPPTPDALDIYAMMMEKYTSPSAIVGIYSQSAEEAGRRLRALLAVQPPAGLEALHQEAVDGYHYIREGMLLIPGANSVTRAEALFMIDWGVSRLWDYRERTDSRLEDRGAGSGQ